MILIENGTLVSPRESFLGDILIEGEKIKRIFRKDGSLTVQLHMKSLKASNGFIFLTNLKLCFQVMLRYAIMLVEVMICDWDGLRQSILFPTMSRKQST